MYLNVVSARVVQQHSDCSGVRELFWQAVMKFPLNDLSLIGQVLSGQSTSGSGCSKAYKALIGEPFSGC